MNGVRRHGKKLFIAHYRYPLSQFEVTIPNDALSPVVKDIEAAV